jgi:hypothetical protein
MTIAHASAETPAARMAAAARHFRDSLEPAQRARLQLPFETEERFNWNFVPMARAGVSFKQMSEPQREAALDLLRAGLSDKGFGKAEAVRALESILAEIERNPVRRDPELYFLVIFGEPTATGTWGWRYEGHHISLNWTLVGGASIASTPQFLGSNPAEVRHGPQKGRRVLAAEEDLARALLGSLTETQRTQAVISPRAPADILSSNLRRATPQEERGLAHAGMTPEQRGLLLALIDEYAGTQPQAVARARLDRLRAAGLENVRFAWMGGLERGKRHYYRVQGPTFLIEYDNTQNGANHIHTVWRDFDGDFGVDLLSEHYRNSPHHQGEEQAGR